MSCTREQQVERIIRQFISDFSKPLDDDAALDTIKSVCSPNIIWIDHGFHNQRTGYVALLGLRKAFNYCNQPFEARIKDLHHTPKGAAVEAIWVGNCKNDIVRPDGEVVVKANGRDFVAHVCFVMEVDPTQGITKINEYYNKPWWEGISENDYKKISGAVQSQS